MVQVSTLYYQSHTKRNSLETRTNSTEFSENVENNEVVVCSGDIPSKTASTTLTHDEIYK